MTTQQAIDIIFKNNVNSTIIEHNIKRSSEILDMEFGHMVRATRGTTERELREVNEKIKKPILEVFGELGKIELNILNADHTFN